MIKRLALKIAKQKLERYPIVAILGPRQTGKTTLARQIASEHPRCHYFDLEKPRDLSRLNEPELALEHLSGLIVIDEIQRKPDLFPLLRVLSDRNPCPATFLILGSASTHLVKGVSESLTGRIGFVYLYGFSLQELGKQALFPLWVRGGLPKSYLAATDAVSLEWREDYITSLLERDVPQLGISIPAATLRRFWNMAAHYHGQIWNGAEMAVAMGVSQLTVRRYLDLLAGMFLIRQLPPWFENIAKRQVKSPKIYFRDTGLLHYFLAIGSLPDLQGHPKLGASWEGFALEQTMAMLQYPDAYFWATHSGAELDLMITRGGRRYGFEFKYTDAPRWSRSLESALHDLQLERVFVIHPGQERFPVHERGEAVPLHAVPDLLPSA
jgi:uncharacterized protein